MQKKGQSQQFFLMIAVMVLVLIIVLVLLSKYGGGLFAGIGEIWP